MVIALSLKISGMAVSKVIVDVFISIK